MLDAQTQQDLAKAIIQLAPVLANDIQVEVNESKWVSPSEAVMALGSGVTQRILRDKITSGRFPYGKEYVDLSDGDRY